MQKLWVIFLIFSSWLGYSQEFNQEYLIDYISINEGLSHNYVSQVVSDSLNIKWIASENGLIKYDGVNFTTIKPGFDYPGLHNENIETLFIDSKNNLWIGTKSGGLSRIKLETGELDNFNEVLKGDENVLLRIRAINEDAKGNIWVGTSENGLFVINNTYNKLLEHYPLKQILSILKDAHGNMWFGSENSLMKYDPSEDRVFTFNLDEESSIITDIVEDKERNCLWLSTESAKIQTDKVIFRFGLNLQKVEKLNTGIEADFFSTLFLDHSNRLWIGTWGQGLYRSDTDFKFKKLDLVYPPENNKTINYDMVLDIHQDKNDVIWISSNFGGIAKLTKGKGFKNLDASLRNDVLKNNLVIHSLYQENGRLWLGTLRNGLFIGENYQNFRQVDFIENTKVFSIHKNNDHYFVGTAKNCYILDKYSRKISSLNIPKATAFLEEGDGKMWIGTQQQGLMFVDTKDLNNPKIIRQYTYQNHEDPIGSKRITSLIRDSQGNMWVGTYNGIYLYDPENRSFISQTNLINTHLPAIINTIFIDNEFIWLGTPNGLYELDYDKNKLKVLDKISIEDGLSNDFICGITSHKNNLWFTTTTGIVCYNIKDNSFLEFDHSDGVYTSQFNIRSFFKDENSRIFTGGTDNVTFFDPDRINKDTVVSGNINLTGLWVNNKRITTTNNKDGDGITLNKNFSYVDKIELNHKEKSFAIGFANSNFANKAQSYRYKLQGYQNEWVNLKSQNEVHFVGLPPGNYKLLISSSNDLHHWAAPKSLNIKIHYAPWLSPWAFILYFVVFCVIVTSVKLGII